MVCTCTGTAFTRDQGSGRSMFGQSGHSATVNELLGWGILLAREPDLDLEFEEPPRKHPVKQPAPKTPKQPGGKRGLLIVLLVMAIAGGAYFSSDPALLLELIDQVMGNLPVAPATPIPPRPPPSAPPATPAGTAPPASPAMTKPTATPAPGLPSPLFVEGQRVMVFADPALPPGPVPLTIEAGGTRSSFTIRPGATVTVVDGELRNNAWVYAVRTEDGAQGWIQEKRLKAKP